MTFFKQSRDRVLNKGARTGDNIATQLFDDIKHHLDVYHGDDDARILALISTAMEFFELKNDTPIDRTAYTLNVPAWSSCIDLPMWPLASVTAVQCHDADGSDFAAVDIANFEQIKRDRTYSELRPKRSAVLPTPTADVSYPVKIDFEAGFDGVDELPDTIIYALKMLVRHYYDNPTPVVVGTSAAVIPFTIEEMVSMHKPTVWVRGVK